MKYEVLREVFLRIITKQWPEKLKIIWKMNY